MDWLLALVDGRYTQIEYREDDWLIYGKIVVYPLSV
jgi:hypothetical protein